MTWSIVAFDAQEQVVGAAVTSCTLAAGRRVLHARAGVGAAVAQAGSEITWGEDILDRVAPGLSPSESIAPFQREGSQVAVMTLAGEAAVHTGDACDPFAGHTVGRAAVAQANTAALSDAWNRMMEAFERTAGPLAERLVSALAASGGDARGEQSAGILVTGQGVLRGYEDEPHVDLRVDDHRDPVAELGRLLSLHRAHCEMRRIFRDGMSSVRVERLKALLGEHPEDPHLQRAVRRVEST